MKRNYNRNMLTATQMNHGAQVVERISPSGTSTPVEKNWTVSEMINPDGSVTIRHSIVNSEGCRIVKEEELSSTNRSLLVKDEFDSEIIGRRNILPLEASHRAPNISSDRGGSSIPPHIIPSKGASKAHRAIRFESESSPSLSSTQIRRNLMMVKRDILRVTADTRAGSDVSTNPPRLEKQKLGLGRNTVHIVDEDSVSSKSPPIKELTAEEEKREDKTVLTFESIWNESPKVLPTNLCLSHAVIEECKSSSDSENSGSTLQFQQHSTSHGKVPLLKRRSRSGAMRSSLSDPDPIYRLDPEDLILTPPVIWSSMRDSRAENLKVLKFCDSRDLLAPPDTGNARDPISRTSRPAPPISFHTNGTDDDDEFQDASRDGSASTLSSLSRIVSRNVSETFHSNIRPTGLQMEAISEGQKPNGWNSVCSTDLSSSPIRPCGNCGVNMEDELQHSSVDGTATNRSSFSKMFGQNIKDRVSPTKSRPQQDMEDDMYESDLQVPTIHRLMPPQIWSERFEDHSYEKSNPLGRVRNFGVTVVKKSSDDKVGINVGVRATRQGNRLVVSKISPTGLIADSNVQLGDIVTSINGYNFVAKPDSLVALDIVQHAREIRFSFQSPAVDPAMDDLSLPTLHRVHNPHTSNLDMTKTLSRESGSHDEILKYRAARRKINIADCSTTVETDQESPAEASSEGPEESMTNSVEELRRSRVSENLYLPASKVEQRDFDEESYGASLGGYNASKTVTVTKSTPVESIGISFLTDHTDWGALLIVSKISSSGLLSKTELWVGDIILAINDVNFRDNPDAEHAAAVISDARNKVCIEFQRISGWKAALPPRQTQTMEVTETLLSDGRKIVRTETFHADKTKKVKIEEFVPPRRVNVPILPNNSYSDISGLASIDVGDMRGLEAASFNDDFQRQGAKQRMLFSVENAEALDADSPKLSHRRDPGLKSLSFDTSFLRRKDVEQEPVHIVQTRIDRNADAQTIMRPRTRESKTSAAIFKATVGPKGTDTIVLTVTKKHSSQEVGISMGTVKGVLYVTKLSPSSLFVGKAILPGDTILSINNISFRKDAATKDAFAAIVNAPNTVTIELKKTGSQKYVLDTDYSDEGASKRCGIFGLLGRGKKSNRSRSLSSGPKGRDRSIRKSKQGEPATPDTSMEVEDFDPFYV